MKARIVGRFERKTSRGHRPDWRRTGGQQEPRPGAPADYCELDNFDASTGDTQIVCPQWPGSAGCPRAGAGCSAQRKKSGGTTAVRDRRRVDFAPFRGGRAQNGGWAKRHTGTAVYALCHDGRRVSAPGEGGRGKRNRFRARTVPRCRGGSKTREQAAWAPAGNSDAAHAACPTFQAVET